MAPMSASFVSGEQFTSSARAKCVAIAEALLGVGAVTGVSTWGGFHALINPYLVGIGQQSIADGSTGQQWLDRMNALASLEVETAKLALRFNTPMIPARATLYNAFYASIKAAAVLPKLDCCYLIGATDQAARRNLKDDINNLTAVNSPAFVADRYFVGDGATSYLSASGYAGGNYSQNSAFMALWSLTNNNNGGADSGDFTAANNAYIVRYATASGRATGRANSGSGLTFGNASYPGFVAWSRISSAAWSGYGPNGAVVTTGTTASVSLTYSGLTLCKGTNQLSFAACGSGLTDAEMLVLHNAAKAFLQGVGAVP